MFIIDDMPEIIGDRLQFKQLFLNLFSNSLKFSRVNVKPKITVKYKVENGFHIIIVYDNGIGVDNKYLNKIFKPFQRLNTKIVYEGNGMGLAICKKVVDFHNGSITADGSPGNGAIFTISLPFAHI